MAITLKKSKLDDYRAMIEDSDVKKAMLDGKDITPFIWKIIAKERKNEN